ncbi:MAG: hypothetical protein J7M29_05105 [Verrucomicrobia bacterium]|nr:hypothetical protein [Verrucomicrobiota bacterium]
MARATDVRIREAALYFLPVRTRVPLKFGPEALTSVICARVRAVAEDRLGRRAEGWGETPLSVQWVWPGELPYDYRCERLKAFTARAVRAWGDWGGLGHPIELGHEFVERRLPALVEEERAERGGGEPPLPRLAALVCCSPLDQAAHDAYGKLHGLPSYATYNARFMNRDLGDFLEPAPGADVSFKGLYPDRFLRPEPLRRLRAWHLVGGLDPISSEDLTGEEPEDGWPTLLEDWILQDGLKCLKVKLRGNDEEWDCERLLRVGRLALQRDVDWLSADFNCTVNEPAYVNRVLDRLRDEAPRVYGMILYVEQPFPYDLEARRIDAHSVSARKPLFLDESAHDWRLIRLGRVLGWSGVALKTCKTQSGAILAACWAQAHGMGLMVQDLTNPMLAQIPHLLLAAHVPTIMGVETNCMQFYPAASDYEARVHPDIYRRREGAVDLSTLGPTGFGYRVEEIGRPLPEPALVAAA